MPINNSIQVRKGSSSEWSSSNTVLSSGELGYDLTNNILKIGDGVTAWNDLTNHKHSSSDINDFNSSVSGLIPVTNIVAGTNVSISTSGSIFTISASGSSGGGLTQEEVDDRVSNLLVGSTGISLNYNDNANTLTIASTGLPIGVGTSGYLSRWTSSSTLSSGTIFDNGTNIGIGLASPSGKLHVIGTGLFASSTGIFPNALLQTYSTTSGATLFSADGTNGNLFSIVDSLSGSLMSVNNIAGLPVFEVFSDDSVVAGRYNQNDFAINSSGNIGMGGAANNSYKLQVIGNVNVSGILSINGVSAKSKTIASFKASDNMPPASSYATLDTRNGILTLDFDDASTEYAVFPSVVPEATNLASGLLVYINWMATSATGSNCVWQAEFKDMDDDLDSITYGTAVTGISAANATNGTPSVATITLSSAQIDGLVSGDNFLLRIARLGGNASDTMTGDAELINVEVRTVA